MGNDRTFITIIIGLLILVVAPYLGVSIVSNNYTPVFIFLGILLFVTVAKHGVIAFSLMLATYNSALILPLPGRPFLWELAVPLAITGLFSGVAFGTMNDNAMNNIKRYSGLLFVSFCYGVMLFVMMRLHNVGLNIFGSEVAGGRAYIQQMILLILPVVAICFGGDRKLIVRLAVLHFLLGTTFVVSDLFFNRWNKASVYVLQFFELSSDTLNFAQSYAYGGIQRWQSLSRLGGSLMLLMFILVPTRRFFSVSGVPLLAIMVGLMAVATLGGHRSTVVEIVAVGGVLLVAQRMISFRYLGPIMLSVFSVLVVAYLYVDKLPDAGQRALSFLPGIDVSSVASEDADKTMEGRRELRARSFQLIDDYFWVGRGFGIDFDLAFNARVRGDSVAFHEIMGQFYSGPIAIFVTCGVFGFILFMIFLITASVICGRMLLTLWKNQEDSVFHRVASVFCGKFIWAALSYCFITGDANRAMHLFIPLLSVLIACEIAFRKSLEEELEEESSDEEAQALQPYPSLRLARHGN